MIGTASHHRLTFTFGEAPASIAERGTAEAEQARGSHRDADDRGLREGVPTVTEGAAALRRAGAPAPGPGRPGHRLPLLRKDRGGGGTRGGVAGAGGPGVRVVTCVRSMCGSGTSDGDNQGVRDVSPLF